MYGVKRGTVIVGCRKEGNTVSGKYLGRGQKLFHQKYV